LVAEDSSETKAILKVLLTDLKSKKADDRIKGAQAIGELGAKGKSACRPLCEAMLDTHVKVRTAAADALKQVDNDLAELAVAIYINADIKAVQKATAMGADAEALCPLIYVFANQINGGIIKYDSIPARASPIATVHLRTCLEALCRVAPDDPKVNAMIISAISLRQSPSVLAEDSAKIRNEAIILIRELKNKKQALKPLLFAAANDTDIVRSNAIVSLGAIYDADNDKIITKALEAMRFDKSESIRKVVDRTLDSNKKKM